MTVKLHIEEGVDLQQGGKKVPGRGEPTHRGTQRERPERVQGPAHCAEQQRYGMLI